ncbi:tripartite tricarboxylate transporter TctB family protein [Nocardiopsis sp. TSRI0078]|uniref:tripartite tricarboxylate transporter TctB family protein n=1 Tax=unclassified Nocardiopsis TaxID=2649073 RepID=UPI00093D6315|nr:tripartite tricarboxylate transporter TctB family protein [Nocardiopsis sp. TSRI0078]OKI23385.1 tripartite tricarboxylate transporter TctB family protein [Nocardiopsis sp. TSRI0078]
MTTRNEETVSAPGDAAGAAGTPWSARTPRVPGTTSPETSNPEATDPEAAPWGGPARWGVPALLAVVGVIALWGAFTIEAPPNATRPGPGAFPGAVGVLLLAVSACMVVAGLRGPREGAAANTLAWFEGRPVLVVLAGLVVHVALLEVLGWLLAGALLFWAVTHAFGSRAHLRDAVVALSMSAAVQVGFSLGLGLNLPGGLLELML